MPSSDACTVQLGSPVDVEAEGRGGRRGKADAGIALRRQLRVERARLLALREVVAVIVEAHGLGLGEPLEHDAADLARVALAIGVERPARFPAVDRASRAAAPVRSRPRPRRPWHRIGASRTSMPAALRRASASAIACLGIGRCAGPARGLEECEAARLLRPPARSPGRTGRDSRDRRRRARRSRRRPARRPRASPPARRSRSGSGHRSCRRG